MDRTVSVGGRLEWNLHIPQYTAHRDLEFDYGSKVTTDDVVGNFDGDNPFQSDRIDRKFAVLNGEKLSWDGVNIQTRFTNYPLEGVGAANPPALPYFPYPNWNEVMMAWVGRMQPGKPGVNLPAIIGEASDIPKTIRMFPKLIKDWGRMAVSAFAPTRNKARRMASTAGRLKDLSRKAGRDVANTHVGIQFGVNPTVADAVAMLNALEHVVKAYEDMMDIANGAEIKRSFRLSSLREVQELGPRVTNSLFAIVKHNVVRVYSEKSWVTSRWAPLIPVELMPQKSPREILRAARKQALGLTPGGFAEAWWELLPWSWLTDWIADVQTKLNLYTGNNMLLRLVSLCWCRTTTAYEVFHQVECPSWLTEAGENLLVRVLKERIPLSPGTLNSHPFQPAFDGRKWGILSGIAAGRLL